MIYDCIAVWGSEVVVSYYVGQNMIYLSWVARIISKILSIKFRERPFYTTKTYKYQ